MFLVLVKPSSTGKRRRGWSESDDDAQEQQPDNSPVRENADEPQESDIEVKNGDGNDDMDEGD